MNNGVSSVFWIENPKILLNKEFITDISFNNNMILEEKLNALTRFIILVSLLGFLLMNEKSILLLGLTFILVIILYYYYLKDNVSFKENMLSTFTFSKNEQNINNPFDNDLVGNKVRVSINESNPDDDYDENVKNTISDINIDNDASGELFDSLESNIGFYDSNRNFNSVPINDQESFLKYAYGSLPSEKNTSVF